MPSLRTSTLSGQHRCRICDKTYSTNSHLRRHEATHFGRQDLTCPSCQARFSRRDLARRHMQNCSAQHHEIILPTLKRGRKRHSCDRCSQRKLSCDTKLPCARCCSSGAACTYEWVDYASSPATPCSDVNVRPCHSQASDAGSSASGQRGGISIEFLLNFTNPSGYRPSATVAAEAVELDDAGGEAHTQLNPADQHMGNDQIFFDFADVPSVFLGFPSFMGRDDGYPSLMGRDDEYPSPIITESLTPELEDAYALEVRVRELVHQLSAQYSSMLERNDAVQQTTFDIQFAESVFTVGNVRHFVWAFFRYFHHSFPILHQPTFNLQTASLPLLLTLVLFGSMSYNESDSSLAVRSFIYIADAYIFDRLVSRQMLQAPQPAFINNEELELIQASLLFLAFLNNINDPAIRRRIRLQRIPSLITAVRASGLFAYRRRPFITAQGTYDWQGFIADEMRSRVGMWTCIFDTTMSIFFNTPPQIAIAEVTGSLPCDEDLFRARSAAEFERVASLRGPIQQAYTLPELTSRLFFAPPRGNEDMENRVTSIEMLVLIFALISTIMSARMNLVASMTTEPMLRATDRWKRVWDSVSQDSEGRLLPHIGFEKHAVEYWWLTRTMLRVMQSGDQSCRYLQLVPCDSGQILYDFIRKYKDHAG